MPRLSICLPIYNGERHFHEVLGLILWRDSACAALARGAIESFTITLPRFLWRGSDCPSFVREQLVVPRLACFVGSTMSNLHGLLCAAPKR